MRFNRIMVMGAGAVGGYFGARIAEKTGAEVTLIARGDHLQAIRDNGIKIKSPEGDSTVRVEAYENPEKAKKPDLILFTVKSYDTADAIEAIRPVVVEQTQILTIQNGIANYDKLVKVFDRQQVIQGFCRIGASITRPGVVEHRSLGSVVVGEADGESSERLQALETLFSNSGIDFTISEDIWHEVWTKFAWNCIFNMITATAQVTVDKLFEQPASEELCHKLFDEIRLVAQQEGVMLNEEDRRKVIEKTKGLQGFTTSTYNDRKKGKKLEFEAFTGDLVRLAEKHGLEVPHNKTVYAFLKLIE